MASTRRISHSARFDRVRAAVITGVVLCIANYGMDALMDRLGTKGSETILNDVAIGILGSLAVYFYLSTSYAKYNFESAKKRILLIAELNLRVREALEAFATSAMSEDRAARLRGIDEATDRIESVLSEFHAEHESVKETGLA